MSNYFLTSWFHSYDDIDALAKNKEYKAENYSNILNLCVPGEGCFSDVKFDI
jgi:hypothetical protein